jgi:hypothetical protein
VLALVLASEPVWGPALVLASEPASVLASEPALVLASEPAREPVRETALGLVSVLALGLASETVYARLQVVFSHFRHYTARLDRTALEHR